MVIRIVTLRFDDNLQGFPEEPVRAATSGREVLVAREHFFTHGGVPHLSLVLELGGGAEEAGRPPARASGMPDVLATVPPDRKRLYLDLKRWRNERAQRDGVPPFVILRNELLADICRRAPHSLAALKEIPGIGEKTVEKYGSEVVALIPEGLHEELRGAVGADRVGGEPGGGDAAGCGGEAGAAAGGAVPGERG